MSSEHTIEINSIFDAPNLTGSPERRLILGILERAILDYVGNDPLEIAHAEKWIFSEINLQHVREFSFTWVCQQLDIDSHKTAEIIKAMPKRGASRIAPWYTSKAYVKARNKAQAKSSIARVAA